MSKKILTMIVSVLVAAIISCSFTFAAFATVNSAKGASVIEPTVGDGESDSSEPDSSEVDESESDDGIEYKPGDVDGNGVVNIDDATFMQLVITGKKEATDVFTKNSDVFIDGKRNISDVTIIQLYVAKRLSAIPVTTDGWGPLIRP